MRAVAPEQGVADGAISIAEADARAPPVHHFVREHRQRPFEAWVGRVLRESRQDTHVDVTLQAPAAAVGRGQIERLDPDAGDVVPDRRVEAFDGSAEAVGAQVEVEAGEDDEKVVVVGVRAQEFARDRLAHGDLVRAIALGLSVVDAAELHDRHVRTILDRAHVGGLGRRGGRDEERGDRSDQCLHHFPGFLATTGLPSRPAIFGRTAVAASSPESRV